MGRQNFEHEVIVIIMCNSNLAVTGIYIIYRRSLWKQENNNKENKIEINKQRHVEVNYPKENTMRQWVGMD